MDIQAFIDKRWQWDGENMSDFPDNPKELVEMVRLLHYVIATSPTTAISFGMGEIYPHSQKLFKSVIALAYPDLDTERIYETWVDCNESIAHCANWVKNNLDD